MTGLGSALQRTGRRASGRLGLSGVGIALGLLASPTYGQTNMTAAEMSDIQVSLLKTLAGLKSQSAGSAAIASAVQAAISQYGSAQTSSIVAIVVSAAEEDKALGCDSIGNGLAEAATDEEQNNMLAAAAIATTVANEGNECEVAAFRTDADALGYSGLAAAAGQQAAPIGSTDGGSSGEPNGATNAGSFGIFPLFRRNGPEGGGPNGCLNPSCTKM